MSTQGLNSTTTAAGPPQYYFCHQCNRRVTITPTPSSELTCPLCNGGLLEEDENQNPNPNPINPNPFFSFDDDPTFPSFSSGFPLVFSTSSRGFQDPPDLSALFGGGFDGGSGGGMGGGLGARSGGGFASPGPGEFSPFAFLQNYLHTLRAGGANIQFVIENNTEGGGGDGGDGFRLPSNLGDYFVGPAGVGSGTRSGGGFASPGSGEFSPFAVLQNYLNTLRTGGANIQFVIENNTEGGGGDGGDGFRLPSNLGDYFVGPGLEQLIQQLAENDPNRYGTDS